MPTSISIEAPSPYQVLDPQNVPIAGNMMIEASAGTGKTYTITLLVLRLLLGLNVDKTPKALPEILIVTFTNAATAELKERIYSRIVDLKQAFFATLIEQAVEDEALLEIIERYLMASAEAGQEEMSALAHAINLLIQAEAAIDQASIFTIHAFSQRLLKENALDLGQSFDFELATDLTALYREAVYHFWREECYPLDFALSKTATNYYHMPISTGSRLFPQKNLFSMIEPLIRDPNLIKPQLFAGIDQLKTLFSAQETFIKAVKCRVIELFPIEAFINLIETVGLKKQSYRADLVKRYHAELMEWAKSDLPALFSNAEKFSLDYMESRLAKEGDIRRMDPHLYALFTDLAAIASFREVSMHYAAFKVVKILKMLKREAGVLGFDDLLTELNKKTEVVSDAFLKSLHLRYRAVMIDEFQDTDNLQLATFRRLFFDHPEIPFVMIGDPKQSIYGFRGADINAYLSIKGSVDSIYTLNTNYRSGARQVDAVNQLFGRRAAIRPPFIQADIPFINIQTPASADETVLRSELRVESGMTLMEYVPEDSELTKTSKSASLSNVVFRSRISSACAKEIVSLLASGSLDTDAGSRHIMPEDITILVRSGTEAADIQKALRNAGLNAVYLSERNSVFDPENSIVTDLYLFLRSLVFRHEKKVLMQSLGSVLYGLSVTEYEAVTNNPERFEILLSERNSLNEIWDKHGVLAMIRAFMVRENRLARLLTLDNGERLASDLFHLGELLQREAFSNKEALLLWLHDKMFGFEEGEGAEIRLESDFKTIQIMTIHKSKGLEFPVVFLPFGLFKTQAKSEGVYIDPETHLRRYVFAADATAIEKDYFADDALAEDIRLLYVALTRAKFHTYIGYCGALKPSHYKHNALGYLLGIDEDIAHFNENFNPFMVHWEIHAKDLSLTTMTREIEDTTLKMPAKFTRQIAPLWRFTSFSNLSYNASNSYFTPLLDDELEITTNADRGDSADTLDQARGFDEPALGDDGDDGAETEIVESLFPKGAITGNFIHALLEDYTPQELQDRALLTAQVENGFSHLVRATRLPALVDELEIWLQDILQGKLPGIFPTLFDILSGQKNIKELEFIFPIEATLQESALNALLQQHLERAPDEGLKFEDITGFLRGFIDLFFEHEGKYYVADYKSNTLGGEKSDYHDAQMRHSIKHAHYDLQYLIYTVAVVKFLQNQKEDFDYERDFGGVYYFYLRGMVAQSENGIYFVKPDYAIIEALMALFGESLGAIL